MNPSSLKSFAPAVRRQLMEAVGRKLDYVLTADTPDLRQAAAQVASLRKEAAKHRAALIERVAYTWFNRLAALRFLDAQGWHPFKARVLTPATPEETQPEILKLLRTGSLPAELHPHTDLQRLNDLLDGRLPTAIAEADPQGEAYRGLILAACRFYHTLLPDVFDKLNDESELLLPDDLLTATSVAEGFRTEITDADCLETDAAGKSRANVEILGWLYQFYISEKKDAVMARKSAVPTEDIPAVTQLFTPHWIVRYLVENSLGRLWLNSRPNSRLRDHMPYFIEDANSVPSDQCRVISGEENTPPPSTAPSDLFSSTDHRSPITDHSDLTVGSPKDIRLVDPAVGSGHMLTYAFDLLTLIYEEEGYAPSEIPALILRHNLHGLEICPRAAQLAELALVFKAREKSRRFFQPDNLVRPHIIELQDIRFEEDELASYFKALDLNPSSFGIPHSSFLSLLHQFEEAKNFGSLIQPCETEAAILEVRRIVLDRWSEITDPSSSLFLRETHRKILRVLDQAETLTQRYHVVVANPPYMGGRNMNISLKNYVRLSFPEGIADLYACFLIRNFGLLKEGGCSAMVTLPSWLSLSSFEALRITLLKRFGIYTLINNGRGLWGSDFGSCAFVLINHPTSGKAGVFKKLFTKDSEVASNDELMARFFDSEKHPRYLATPKDLQSVPGCPIAFTASSRMRDVFLRALPLNKTADARKGLVSLDDRRWMKSWTEVSRDAFNPGAKDATDALNSKKRWFPVNKGGFFRKWYGCNDTVIHWENDGQALKDFIVERYGGGSFTKEIRSEEFYFKENITWGYVTIGAPSFRYTPHDFFSALEAHVCFLKNITASFAVS